MCLLTRGTGTVCVPQKRPSLYDGGSTRHKQKSDRRDEAPAMMLSLLSSRQHQHGRWWRRRPSWRLPVMVECCNCVVLLLLCLSLASLRLAVDAQVTATQPPTLSRDPSTSSPPSVSTGPSSRSDEPSLSNRPSLSNKPTLSTNPSLSQHPSSIPTLQPSTSPSKGPTFSQQPTLSGEPSRSPSWTHGPTVSSAPTRHRMNVLM